MYFHCHPCALLLSLLLLTISSKCFDQSSCESNSCNQEDLTIDNNRSNRYSKGHVSVNGIFGKNSQYFTVCSTLECIQHTLQSPDHAEKLMLFVPTIHVDGDSYLSYYMGLIFDTFVFQRDESDIVLSTHILVYSLSYAMPEGPFYDLYAVQLVEACNSHDFSKFSRESCLAFRELLSDFANFTRSGKLYHKRLGLVVLNDATIVISYYEMTLLHSILHNTSLFTIIHLNHEQPWIDHTSAVNNQEIEMAYDRSVVVFRTHYFSDYMKRDNVFYLPLGSGLFQSERVALGLKPSQRRFRSVHNLTNLSSSMRSWLCSFAGSMKYQYRNNTIEQSRAEMIYEMKDVPGCVFYPTDDVSVAAPLTQEQYLKLTHSTMFSLCPRGVGPETNRPHQALQLGAIPIMVRESDAKKDFLVEWSDYPGPIFSNWYEVKCFLYDVLLGRISLSNIDALQSELQLWYSTFMRKQRDIVKHRLLQAIDNRENQK